MKSQQVAENSYNLIMFIEKMGLDRDDQVSVIMNALYAKMIMGGVSLEVFDAFLDRAREDYYYYKSDPFGQFLNRVMRANDPTIRS